MIKKRFNLKIKDVANFYEVSEATVREWVETQFKYKTHYIDVRKTNAKNAQLRFNLEAIADYLETEPEKR